VAALPVRRESEAARLKQAALFCGGGRRERLRSSRVNDPDPPADPRPAAAAPAAESRLEAGDHPDDSINWFVVEPNYAGWTLADFFREKMKRPPEPARMEKMLRGRALVHGEGAPLGPESRVWPGLRVGLRRRFPGDEGEPPPVPVVFEDEALLVVDKPAGLALHPTARYFKSTLTWVLEARHRNPDGQKPDPAHRLDRETSGLVACGRTPRFTKILKAAFAARRVGKAYLALCEGEAREERFEIDLPLSVGTPRIKVKVRVDPAGQAARTECTVVHRYQDTQGLPLTLVRCVPLTGRQHQLRVHLSAAGLPLVGDKIYGPDEGIFLRLAESEGRPPPPGTFDARISPEERARLRLPRQALHASELQLQHPGTGVPMIFTAPLPADLEALLAACTRLA
jgi:23S rRNA pseudouridine1911/1915/1917 synthase